MGDVITFKRPQATKNPGKAVHDPLAARIDHITGLPPAGRLDITVHQLRAAVDEVLAPTYHDLLDYSGGSKPLSLQGRSLKTYLAQDLIGKSLDDRALVGLHGLALIGYSNAGLMRQYHKLRQQMRALSVEAARIRLKDVGKAAYALIEADLIERTQGHLIDACRLVLATSAAGYTIKFGEQSRLIVALAGGAPGV